MRKFLAAPFIFIIYFMGYSIVAAIMAGIVAYFFPLAGLIVGALLLIGVVTNAWEKTGEKLGNMSEKAYKKKLSKQWATEELAQFDRSLQQMSRRVH